MACDVSIREVGLRDGLQLVADIVLTETKLDWCRQQYEAGFTEIEVTSFVPPSVIPQFSDAGKVLAGAKKNKNLLASVLVPNLKGALLALDAGAKKITFVMSASELHNQSNVRMSTDDSLAMFADLLGERASRGLAGDVLISGVIATSFGCTIQGDVPQSRVCQIAEEMAAMGADEINIADTVGYGNPAQVSQLFEAVQSAAGDVPLAAHIHDTRGLGLANVTAAVDAGVCRFDASLGGLGGCPFAPGATGNIATEDCVYLLESLGLSTGVDIKKLIELRKKLEEWLPEETLKGNLLQAGIAKTFKSTKTLS